jgi:hypothetical protein
MGNAYLVLYVDRYHEFCFYLYDYCVWLVLQVKFEFLSVD